MTEETFTQTSQIHNDTVLNEGSSGWMEEKRKSLAHALGPVAANNVVTTVDTEH